MPASSSDRQELLAVAFLPMFKGLFKMNQHSLDRTSCPSIGTGRRFIDSPVFVTASVAISVLAGVLGVVQGWIANTPALAMLGGTAIGLALLIFGVSLWRWTTRKAQASAIPSQHEPQQSSMESVVFGLVAINTSLLSVGYLVYDLLLRRTPATVKDTAVIGVILVASVYLRLRGRVVARQASPNTSLTLSQSAAVVVVTLGVGAFFVWLMV